MLHGAIVWLVAVPFLMSATAIGAGGVLGGWYAGLGSYRTPAMGTSEGSSTAVAANATQTATPNGQVASNQVNNPQGGASATPTREEAAKATRNGALTAASALLLGLMGSVVGGWMASGEPMTLTHHVHRHVANRAA